jgi:MerR family mercuric resistance operon transcriptional regulator
VLLSLSESRDADCQSVKTMAEIHAANVRAKIAELRMLEAALSELTVNCSGGSVACSMLDQLQTA